MNEHTLLVLEYDKIRQRLAAEAASSLGIERALDLVPSVDEVYIQSRLDETTEARQMLAMRGTIPLGGITDIRGLLRQAQIGGILDANDLVDIATTVSSSRRLKSFLSKTGREQFALLAGLSDSIGIFTHIEESIETSIGPGGHVVDSASPELSKIRSRRRSAERRIQEKLNAIVTGPQRSLLQDPVIVQRNDRWCIPVKADYRNALGGIVHDTSSSGATLFIEPAAVVSIGNELRELAVQESQEVIRILTKLTDLVRQNEAQIFVTVTTVGTIDFIIARARFSDRLNAVEPSISTGPSSRILSARHPLIDPETVVPIDITLGSSDNQVLLITGPNTGGKTVTLKTVGLIALMAQSGLHVPASRAEISIFESIFADIGDEQSIEQSLSTFSSHVTQIASILRDVNSRSLVLLDEVGAGTDPEEGSALARAILEFMRKRGARVIATSHYGELKAYAFSTPGVQNASVEFNDQTLRPTYRLLQGIPGSSHAIAIASRLGLPEEVLAFATAEGDGKDVSAETVRALEEARRTALIDSRAAQAARREAEELRGRLEKELTEYEGLRREIRQKALEEARGLIRRTQEKASHILADIRRHDARQADAEVARQEISLLGSDLSDDIEDILQLPQQAETIEDDLGRPLRQGDRVRVTTLNLAGILLSDIDSEGKVPVQVGALRVVVPASTLRSVKPLERKPAPVRSITNAIASAESASEVSQQITLIGQRVDEATNNVTEFIDQALAAGLKRIRIVHGKGSGVLRRAIHERLKLNSAVLNFVEADPAEGGSGATIVELKES
jgi:DNA mismatch repair protein MutS2